MKLLETLSGYINSAAVVKQPPPVVLCEAEIETFQSVYPQLTRAEVILVMVRFGPARHRVEDAMRWKASAKMRELEAEAAEDRAT